MYNWTFMEKSKYLFIRNGIFVYKYCALYLWYNVLLYKEYVKNINYILYFNKLSVLIKKYTKSSIKLCNNIV